MFDDAGNDGLNLLKATVGDDAVVRAGSPASDVVGIGNLTPTNGEGCVDGTGAIAIPVGQFLSVPHGLAQTTGARWFLCMRLCRPVTGAWFAPLSLSANNTSDAFIFGNPTYNNLGSNGNWGGYSSKGLTAGTWHTLVLSCDGTKTSFYLDGTFCRETIENAQCSQGTDLTGLSAFIISGDNNGEDALLFVDYLIVGSGTWDESGLIDKCKLPTKSLVASWTGAQKSHGLADTDDYTVVTTTSFTDCGFHPIQLVAKDGKTWWDGSTTQLLYFTIRDAILFPELRVHYTFDDAGNDGLSLLKATVGDDAIVRAGSNPATNVVGIGKLTAVNGEGRADGTGAIAIPVGQFLAFDHKLPLAVGVKYRLDMRLRVPPSTGSGWRSIFMLDTQKNADDAALLVKSGDPGLVGSGTYFGWSSPVKMATNAWNTVSILSDGQKATLQINGQWGADSFDNMSSRKYNYTITTNLPMFGISGDNNGEDNPLWFDDLKLYAEGPSVPVVPPTDTETLVYTGEPQLLIANARTYAVKGSAYGTAAGSYPVTVGLLDPATTTWSDGSTTDKVVVVRIFEYANSWVREPAIGATVWTVDETLPALDSGESAYGTPAVFLDGFPYVANQPLSAGEHTFEIVVAPTDGRTKLSVALPVTVLPAGSVKPRRLTAEAYVTNGITMLLDGKDNVGFGRHDNVAATWVDLSGNGYDWTVNSSYAIWQPDGLTLKASGAGNMAAALADGGQTFSGRISAVEFIWKTTTMQDGIIFGPGWASLDYLFTDEDGKVCFFNKKGVSASVGVANAYSVNYNRTAAQSAATGVANVKVDGVAVNPITADYFTSGMDRAPGIGNRYLYSLAARGDLRTLRLYARNLTDDERAVNAAVDYIRYGVGALPAALATDGYRVENGDVLVRFSLAIKRGVASVNGGVAVKNQTLWVPIGSTVTVQTTFNGVTPERAAAFERTGLPPGYVCSADGMRFTFVPQGPVAVQVSHPDAAPKGTVMIFR
jgi:hypothetical protein